MKLKIGEGAVVFGEFVFYFMSGKVGLSKVQVSLVGLDPHQGDRLKKEENNSPNFQKKNSVGANV